jgi:hypothetical protein
MFTTPLFQGTQITNEDPNTHIQRGKRINETMSFHPESFAVPNQLVYCLIFTCTHTHQIFNYSKSTKMPFEQSNVQIKALTQCKQSISLPFGPQSTTGEPTSIRKILFCLPCSHQHRSSQTLEIARR